MSDLKINELGSPREANANPSFPQTAVERSLTDEIEQLKKENFAFAGSLCHDGYGDEGGHWRCKYQDTILQFEGVVQDMATEIAQLRKECDEAEERGAQREREECAVMCENEASEITIARISAATTNDSHAIMRAEARAARNIAELIRARGNLQPADVNSCGIWCPKCGAHLKAPSA